MRKRLELALMATSAIATLLSPTLWLEAAANPPIHSPTEHSGGKVSANGIGRRGEAKRSFLARETFPSQADRSVYRTSIDHRLKPVLDADWLRARPAAAELDPYRPPGFQNSSSLIGFSRRDPGIGAAAPLNAQANNAQANIDARVRLSRERFDATVGDVLPEPAAYSAGFGPKPGEFLLCGARKLWGADYRNLGILGMSDPSVVSPKPKGGAGRTRRQ